MSRLGFAGYETLDTVGPNAGADLDPSGISGTATFDSVVFRTGLASCKCNSGAGNATAGTSICVPVGTTFVASTTNYGRIYMRFTDLPTSTTTVVSDLSGISAGIKVTSGGVVQLWDLVSNTQIGSNGPTVTAGSTWYMFELSVTVNGSQVATSAAARIDGTQFASGSVAGVSTMSGQIFVAGWVTPPGANKVVNIDDGAHNDSQGAANNSWCDSGGVVLLLPTADSAKGLGWTNDAAGASNFFDAVDNKPPVGIADTTASTGLHQIRNATANANSNYDATLTTYTAAGVPAGATINAVLPYAITAAPVTTSAKAGTLGVVSNPAIANIALDAAGTSGAFWSGAAAGTFPVGWKGSRGTLTATPTVVLGTAPVLRITQVTSSTRIAIVCFMGMYVDYSPAVVAAVIPKQNVLMAPYIPA